MTDDSFISVDDVIAQVDVAFVVDTTGSMQPFLDDAKARMREQAEKIAAEGDLNIRYAVVEYRDHPPQDVLPKRVFQFGDAEHLQTVLNGLMAAGGGDRDESVWDGLVAAGLELQWRPHADKLLFLIGDSPPHDPCACHATASGVIEVLGAKHIKVHAYSIAGYEDTTAAFQEISDATGGSIEAGAVKAAVEYHAHTLDATSSLVGATRSYTAYVHSTGGVAASADAAVVADAMGWTPEMVTGVRVYAASRGIDVVPPKKPRKKKS